MNKLFAFILIFLLSFQHTNAADKPKPITRFGFIILNGGTIIIRAQIDSISDTLNFILDTGCGGMSLDSVTAEEFKIPTVKTDIEVVGIAGTKKLSFAYNHTLKLSGLNVDSVQFHINDYDILTCANGLKIDGIIGYGFFNRYIVSIDYDENIIEIYDTIHFKYPRNGYYLHPEITPLPHQEILLTDSVAVVTNLIFDTGAGLFSLLNNKCVNEKGLLMRKRKKYKTQAEGIGGKKQADITIINKIKIGNYTFRDVPVYLMDDEYNVTGYPSGCGLIGNEILRRFNTVINYHDNIIYIKPNSHYYDNFDYAYTGLSVYNIDNKVVVTDIMPSSPGEKAGFLPDDIIIAIDNVIIINVQQCKNLFQNADKTLFIWIERDGKTILKKLEIKNILKS